MKQKLSHLTEDAPMPDTFKSMPLPKRQARKRNTYQRRKEVLPDPKKKGLEKKNGG